MKLLKIFLLCFVLLLSTYSSKAIASSSAINSVELSGQVEENVTFVKTIEGYSVTTNLPSGAKIVSSKGFGHIIFANI